MFLLGFSATSSVKSKIPSNYSNLTNETFFEFFSNETSSRNQNETFEADFSIEDESYNLISYLPICAIILAAIGYHIGLSPITWSYMGEFCD